MRIVRQRYAGERGDGVVVRWTKNRKAGEISFNVGSAIAEPGPVMRHLIGSILFPNLRDRLQQAVFVVELDIAAERVDDIVKTSLGRVIDVDVIAVAILDLGAVVFGA